MIGDGRRSRAWRGHHCFHLPFVYVDKIFLSFAHIPFILHNKITLTGDGVAPSAAAAAAASIKHQA